MHESSILRMKWFVDHYASEIPKKEVKVLDVGSYDINGSYKPIFNKKRYKYTGLDMEDGPNVDIVLQNPYDWDTIAADSFDIVISGQAFEHIEFFWITMSEMVRVLKKDGLLCLIAPKGFGEHRRPVDCYRFFTDGMVALARYVSLETLHAHTNSAPSVKDADWFSETCADSMLIAKKPYQGKAHHPVLKVYKCVPENQEALRDGMVPYAEKNGKKRLWNKIRRGLF
ncbi:class I SAM-dependent methyltransferase [Thermodesulfobacteriota bacterium]